MSMDMPKKYADTEIARATAKRLFPNAQTIILIEHSYDNIVVLVDHDYAVRFPRNKNAYLRSMYEKRILGRLGSLISLVVPRVLSEGLDPPHFVTSFVPGHHLSASDIRTFSVDEQQAFGEAVAEFAYEMHISLSLEEELVVRKKLGLDDVAGEEPWSAYFKRVVYDGRYNNANQTEIAQEHFAMWRELCDTPSAIVVHDDLHTLNMMFEENRLVGVIDFGDTNVGTPEQELRQLYRINETVVFAAVNEYERLSGKKLNIDALKLWAIMQELAVYSKMLSAGDTEHHSFKRACRNLDRWLEGGDWSKGYTLFSTLSQ